MAKLTLNKLPVAGKRVLMRVDYNVPMQERDGQRVISDVTRIKETLPTLDHLIKQGARIVLMGHLGRPKGKPDPAQSLRPVAAKLADLLGRPVAFVDECIGEKVEKTIGALQPGDVLLVENLRFCPGEESNDPDFASKLASRGEVYVNDAFGAAHRAHASVSGVPTIMAARGAPCAAGFLMERELRFLGEELENPARPFVVILGGAKVSDKITVINRLLDKADVVLIGGAMAYTFRMAQGYKTGKSLVETKCLEIARSALEKAKSRGVRFLLPIDDIIALPVDTGQVDKKGNRVIEWQDHCVNAQIDLPEDAAGVDIGPATVAVYAAAIETARTLLWNGPMGIFEDPRFAEGTYAMARAVAAVTQRKAAKSVIGGGDSVKALNNTGLANQVSFVSTGGGASLEFLEGRELPGVAALSNA